MAPSGPSHHPNAPRPAGLTIERDLLYRNLEINDRYPIMYGNTEANLLLGMLVWGQALGDPERVREAMEAVARQGAVKKEP